MAKKAKKDKDGRLFRKLIYLQKRSAKFCNQIVTTDMSEPGDSGSADLTNQNQVFGLLFAGE